MRRLSLHQRAANCWCFVAHESHPDLAGADDITPGVIVGGGFGALSAASALRSAPVSVTLIDKRNYHLFRPMLYQVATGLLSGDENSSPLRSIFSGQKKVRILFVEATGINPGQRVVHLGRGDVPYDYLILATGIQYNYFGHDEWRQFASGLESLDDADIIRGKVLRAFEQAEEMASIERAQLEEIRRQLYLRARRWRNRWRGDGQHTR